MGGWINYSTDAETLRVGRFDTAPTSWPHIGGGITNPYLASISGHRAIVKGSYFVSAGIPDYHKEIAAYTLSQFLPGLVNVPPTTIRDIPELSAHQPTHSVQAYVEHVGRYFRDARDYRGIPRSDLMGAVLFDILISNTDRHHGNRLVTTNKRLVLIDHGLAFHSTSARFDTDSRAFGNVFNRKMPAYIHSFMRDRLLSRSGEITRALTPFLPIAHITAVFERAERLDQMIRFPSRWDR